MGVVRINLAKLITRTVTAEEIAAKKHYVGKKRDQLIDKDCYRCLLPLPGHPEFLRNGKETGNLMKHANKHHQPFLDALATTILENPKEQAEVWCHKLVKDCVAPVGPLRQMSIGLNHANVSNEILCLIWFLDAKIALCTV